MTRYLLPILMIAAGLAVMAFSIAWTRLSPPSSRWSPEQAKAYEEAERRYRQVVSSPPEQQSQQEIDQANDRFQEMLRQRNAALGGRARTALFLQMLGVGLGLIGAVWLILRQDEAKDLRVNSR